MALSIVVNEQRETAREPMLYGHLLSIFTGRFTMESMTRQSVIGRGWTAYRYYGGDEENTDTDTALAGGLFCVGVSLEGCGGR